MTVIHIYLDFPSSEYYGSSKLFVLTAVGPLGGRNIYLGFFCILAGFLYLFGAALIYAKNRNQPRAIGDAHLIEFMEDIQQSNTSSPVAQSINDLNISINPVQRRKTRDYSRQ